ncbi:metallophosphoesterase family protein [Thiorhodovibrio frisius]|uniref:Putative phosphoesterase n=1 Tax=Thiorhodovibrio frisius TaxID=631362 RepID=H8Z183_9GAMM|nr:metallophosphoesterase family protein [Thiorhodovibrio frisius]EIC21398.1 putative phosphoesterase [Thiorhodovibrio frisius]WPL23984.1 phosphodiesterase, family [Thiorhodovibrio frisius]
MSDPTPLPQRLRVALLADTHGQIDPRILALVADCDMAVHGGDIGSVAVLASLQPKLGQVYAVRGNNDVHRDWPVADQALLERIPGRAQVDLPGGLLVVEHSHRMAAAGRHERLRRRYPQARAIVYGHSHRLVVDCECLPWVLNPGAAGRSRTCGGPSCLVLTASLDRWEIDEHRFALPPRSKHQTAARL